MNKNKSGLIPTPSPANISGSAPEQRTLNYYACRAPIGIAFELLRNILGKQMSQINFLINQTSSIKMLTVLFPLTKTSEHNNPFWQVLSYLYKHYHMSNASYQVFDEGKGGGTQQDIMTSRKH